MQYTDDPCFLVVGVKRAALAVKVWHEIIHGSRLMPAKSSKWQIGAGVRWLGGCCYPSLGVMWVPRDKALRVRQRIQTVLDGTCTPKEYQEIVGFLEHVVDIGRFPREMMQYLHGPMRAGGECETDPHGSMPSDGRRDGYLRKWRSILLNAPGASLLSACEQPTLDTTAHAVWRLRSDAMLEPHEAAMGGCLYGVWWRFPLRRPELTIPVLELLAACVNFIVFTADLQGARHVVMEIDALASPTVLSKDKARAPGLRAVLAEFRRLPQLPAFTEGNRLFCQHCWGEANPLGDAASRGYHDVLRALGAALKMQMRQVRMGADALAFISRVLARLDAQPLTQAEIEFDSTLGYPGEGPPRDANTPPSSSALAAGSPSPELIAFVQHAESAIGGLGAADDSPHAAASPSPPLHHTTPPSPVLYLPAATPSPPIHHAAAPPSRATPPAAPSWPPPHADLSPPSPVVAAFAAAETWSPSVIPEPADIHSAEAAHRTFAAAQCAHAAAERTIPSLLTQTTSCAAPSLQPPATTRSSAAPPFTSNLRATTDSASAMSLAAKARAAELSAALLSEAATGGLRIEEDEADLLSVRLVQLLETAAASNTLQGERSNWKHWTAFCAHRGIEPFRKDVRGMDHAAYDKEVVVLALSLLFIYGRMSSRKGRTTPPRPSSALAVLRGIRRAHARLGVHIADLSLATRLADALNREYIEAHGWEALQVDRVAPLTNPLIAGMLNADAVAGDSVAAVSGRALWATLAQTGFRKAEVSLGSSATLGPASLTRHNLRWRIGGVETADPTTEQLQQMTDGDLAILIPPKSKCDQFGLEWGQAPIYLRFHSEAPICAARALRDLELRLPRYGRQQREGTALFTRNDGSPLTAGDVDRLFKLCLQQAGVPTSSTARYSLHRFRRYLACALKAQGASDSTIQALLRWKTSELLKLYSILNDESYANLIDDAGSADVSSVRTNAPPRAEFLDAASSFHNARANLAAAAQAAQARDPSDDHSDHASEQSNSDSEDDDCREPLPPQQQPPPRKRTRAASRAPPARPSPPPPLPPLTIDNAIDRRAIVPAHVWPSYTCDEHEGAGWEVRVDQVDKRISAVLISFVNARDSRGAPYAREWLKFESLTPPR